MARQRKKQVKKASPLNLSLKRTFIISFVAIVSLFGFLGLFGENGLLDSMKYKNLYESLQKENQELLVEQKNLKEEILLLKEPSQVEYLAREKLGLMKEDEVFLILDQSEDSSTKTN
ncbi:MAG: septum formation initiator family protein [Deltaproteobacteria bacterium]|nr:septum formation initiator family protein [Deltaproteobacteria bacterium]